MNWSINMLRECARRKTMESKEDHVGQSITCLIGTADEEDRKGERDNIHRDEENFAKPVKSQIFGLMKPNGCLNV